MIDFGFFYPFLYIFRNLLQLKKACYIDKEGCLKNNMKKTWSDTHISGGVSNNTKIVTS